MNRRAFLARVGGVGVVTGLAGCGGSRGETGDYDVGMTARKFTPATIEVSPGTTVVWKNTSTHAHTVTAYDERIPEGTEFWSSAEVDSQSAAESGWLDGNEGAIYQDETFEHTFEIPGTHKYFCVPHEAGGMVGAVIVAEDGSSESAETDA